MRLILKVLAAPVMLLLMLVVAFCKFILTVTGFIFWLLSVLVFVGAVILLFTGQTAGGITFLVVAFLVSPYGLPALVAWLAGGKDERPSIFAQGFLARIAVFEEQPLQQCGAVL